MTDGLARRASCNLPEARTRIANLLVLCRIFDACAVRLSRNGRAIKFRNESRRIPW